jgi:hypothetical protein
MAGLLGMILSYVSDLDTGFGLVIGFIGLLHLVSVSNHSAIVNSQCICLLQHVLSLLSLSSLAFARLRLPRM